MRCRLNIAIAGPHSSALLPHVSVINSQWNVVKREFSCHYTRIGSIEIFGIGYAPSRKLLLEGVVWIWLAWPPELLSSLVDPFVANCVGASGNAIKVKFNNLLPFLCHYLFIDFTYPTSCPLKQDTLHAESSSRPLPMRAGYTKMLRSPSSATVRCE